MKSLNYLDVTPNLENSTYRSYQKENNQIKYTNIESNHPPSTIKQLPISIKSRLSRLSSSEEIFNDFLTQYQDAVDKLGYKRKLMYQVNVNISNNRKNKKETSFVQPTIQQKRKNQHRKNVSKSYNLFNKNAVKISYSCTRNIKTIINLPNAKILFPKKITKLRTYNCSNKDTCPLEQ